MPLPILAGAALGAGSQLAGGLINSAAQQRANDQNLVFSREMYERQRRDALEFWNMQNTYNSPANQMARFREAGLNPNLIYGQGNNGNAGTISTPDVQPVNFRASTPGDGLASAGLTFLNSMYDLRIKGAQADNLETQNEVIQQDAKLRAVQVAAGLTRNGREMLGLSLDSELYSTNADLQRERLRQTKVTTDIALRRDEREAVMQSSNLREAAQRIINMRMQAAQSSAERARILESVQQIKRSNILQDLEIQLRKRGITWNDPMYARVAGRIIGEVVDGNGPTLLESLKKLFR